MVLDSAEETHSLFRKHWQHCVSSKTRFVSWIQSSSFVVKKLLLLWINLRGSISVLCCIIQIIFRLPAVVQMRNNPAFYLVRCRVSHIYNNRCPTKHRKDEGNIFIFPSLNNHRKWFVQLCPLPSISNILHVNIQK